MKPFKQFQILWHTFDSQSLKAEFSYSFDGEIHFTESINFSSPIGSQFKPIKSIDTKIIDNLLFHLSIVLWISYYKLYPTASIEIKSWKLEADQINFREQFYINGLWEFFFTNNLKPFTPKFISGWNDTWKTFNITNSNAIIPLGWGKDSLVSVEMIRKTWIPFVSCTFGKDNPLYEDVNTIIGVPRLFISRKMDPLLFKMNTEWYYNGHVPISGIIAFSLTVVAYLYDYKYIVMSNEKSANEGNTEIDWMVINHQRSKSLEFEKAFDKYVHTYISPDLKYFSLLRWMYEIQIAQKFSKYPQYFSAFSSCNKNFKILSWWTDIKKWCCQCPKCAFVYTILRPRITTEQTIQIFGKELYEDESLKPLFKELLGISGIKPFECVGTNEEVILAMHKFYEKWTWTWDTWPIIELFKSEILPHMNTSDFDSLEAKLMKTYNENNIPEECQSK